MVVYLVEFAHCVSCSSYAGYGYVSVRHTVVIDVKSEFCGVERCNDSRHCAVRIFGCYFTVYGCVAVFAHFEVNTARHRLSERVDDVHIHARVRIEVCVHSPRNFVDGESGGIFAFVFHLHVGCRLRVVVSAENKRARVNDCGVSPVATFIERYKVALCVGKYRRVFQNTARTYVEHHAVGVSAVVARVGEFCNTHVVKAERTVAVEAHYIACLTRVCVRDGEGVGAVFCLVGQHFHRKVAFVHRVLVIGNVEGEYAVVALVAYADRTCRNIRRHACHVGHCKKRDEKHERQYYHKCGNYLFHISPPCPDLRTPF